MNHDVIVTGATGRIGSAVCCMFSGLGKNVLRVSKSLNYDLTDRECVRATFSIHRAPYLVNCFALNDVMSEDHASDMSVESFEQYMAVNVTALYNVCREWCFNNNPGVDGEDGAIVNFSSIYGVVSPDPDVYKGMGLKAPGYSVSKAAVIALTKYQAMHYHGIRSNCIVLGPIYDTKMPEEFIERMHARHPTSVFGKAQEVCGLVKLLCSLDSRFMNGSAITLDGGYTAT